MSLVQQFKINSSGKVGGSGTPECQPWLFCGTKPGFPQAAGNRGLELKRDTETENVYLGIGSVTGITWFS